MTEEVELITVGQYGETMQAELAKGRLDSAGIPSFLVGENAAMLYGTGLGGLKLQVSPQDEADARTILADPGTTDADVDDPATPQERLAAENPGTTTTSGAPEPAQSLSKGSRS